MRMRKESARHTRRGVSVGTAGLGGTKEVGTPVTDPNECPVSTCG